MPTPEVWRKVVENRNLVEPVARKYARVGALLGLDYHDLVQEGTLGLLHAVEKHDPAIGPLEPYARFWIRAAICRAIQDTGRTIGVPAFKQELQYRIRQAESKLAQEFGREPTAREISNYLELPEGKIVEAMEQAKRPVSLEEHAFDGEAVLSDFVADRSAITPENQVIQKDLGDRRGSAVKRAIDSLDAREAFILRESFGFWDGDPKSTGEIRLMLDETISRERVRQLLQRGLRDLKREFPELKEMMD